MSVIEIFTKPGCGWAERNYAALIEKRIAFRTVLSCDAHGDKTAAFLALGPYGATPVLRFGDAVIWESGIINEFIDDCFPSPALRPATPAGRAHERLWVYHCDAMLTPALKRIAQSDGDGRAAGFEALDAGLAQLSPWVEARADRGPYWGGARIALVDIAFHTFFQALAAIDATGWRAPPTLNPALAAWRDAIAGHPSIRAAGELAAAIALDRPVIEIAGKAP